MDNGRIFLPNNAATHEFSKDIHFNQTVSTSLKIENVDIVFIIQQLFSLSFNIPLLVCMTSERKIRRQKANQFFINLLVVHILLSLIIIAAKFYQQPEETIIVNNGFFMEMFLGHAICLLDRYINIALPYKYVYLTTVKILAIISGSWLVSLITVFALLVAGVTLLHITIISTAMIVGSMIILGGSNIHIYLIAKRHAGRIMKVHTATTNISKERKALKATYVCFSLVMTFVILWMPLLIHNGMVLMNYYIPSNEKLFTKIAFHIGCLTSIVDPILYACFRKEIKICLKKFMRSLSEKNILVR